MEYTILNTYRFERKFIAENIESYNVELFLKMNPFSFNEIFHERYINNIYLDTPRLDFYYDNVAGSHNRIKFRIRWYGNMFGLIEKPILEIKIKKGNVGTKKSFFLKKFTFTENFDFKILNDIFNNSNLPNEVLLKLKNLSPSLINRYKRKYFSTFNEKYRITLDKNIEYMPVNTKNFTHFCYNDYNKIVVELKYNNKDNKFADSISQHIPFRLTKNSKYVSGIEKFYYVID